MEPGESDIALRGRILVDWEIREYAEKYGMIEPFENHLVREGVISYGLSSMGYDIRIADEFKIFTNINTTVVDPKHFDPRSFIDVQRRILHHPTELVCIRTVLGVFSYPTKGVGDLHRQIDLCPLRHRRQHYSARVRVGGASDDRNLQYDPVAGENL